MLERFSWPGLARYVYAPTMLLGMNATAVAITGSGRSAWLLGPLLGIAIALSFLAEQVLPYHSDWNRPQGDRRRDAFHAIVNETANGAFIAATPLLVAALGVNGRWPDALPFALQVLLAVVVFDAGITIAHWLSHKWQTLWRFHAVHHSVERMYGFNGLMKHPLHQAVEMFAGATPLVLAGMPLDVAATLGFCTAVQLLLQHSNVDYELGRLGRWIACNRVHRFHHLREAGAGDVNFGLFTTIWDRMLGTMVYNPSRNFTSHDLGLADCRAYPRDYLGQLREPFRRRATT
ncbi:MAG: sterol desaturase family protein [Candidatus Binatia bacterium]